jgi:hypothetical protein
MVLFTPITTVTFEGVKFRDSLSPTSSGRTIWTKPGWVVVDAEAVLVEAVELELAVVAALDDEVEKTVVEEERMAVVDEEPVVTLVDSLLVVEARGGGAEVEAMDVVSSSEDEVGVTTCAGADAAVPVGVL